MSRALLLMLMAQAPPNNLPAGMPKLLFLASAFLLFLAPSNVVCGCAQVDPPCSAVAAAPPSQHSTAQLRHREGTMAKIGAKDAVFGCWD